MNKWINASTKSCLHVAFHEMALASSIWSLWWWEKMVPSEFLESHQGQEEELIGPLAWGSVSVTQRLAWALGSRAGRSHKHYCLHERRPRASRGCWDPLREPRGAPAGAHSVLPHSCAPQQRNAQGDRLVGCKTRRSTWTEVMWPGTSSVTHKSLSPVPRILSYSGKQSHGYWNSAS